MTTTAYTRKSAAGTKVYVHAECGCHRFNGARVKTVTTVAEAEAYAAQNGFTTTVCKTSTVTAAPVVEEAPAETAPVVAEPVTVEEPTPAPAAPKKKLTRKQQEEARPTADFSIEVNNRDQFGAQRRAGIAAFLAAAGVETTFTAVKNKHKTGNDAFIVHYTWTVGSDRIAQAWLETVDEQVLAVIAEAKEAAKAEGKKGNELQKAWKLAARTFITESAEKFAWRCAGNPAHTFKA